MPGSTTITRSPSRTSPPFRRPTASRRSRPPGYRRPVGSRSTRATETAASRRMTRPRAVVRSARSARVRSARSARARSARSARARSGRLALGPVGPVGSRSTRATETAASRRMTRPRAVVRSARSARVRSARSARARSALGPVGPVGSRSARSARARAERASSRTSGLRFPSSFRMPIRMALGERPGHSRASDTVFRPRMALILCDPRPRPGGCPPEA
jgi:hypothetical protein